MPYLLRSEKPHRSFLFSFFLLWIFSASVWGQDQAAPSAVSILKRAQDKMYQLKDQRATLTFSTHSPSEKEQKSVLELYWKNYEGKEGINSKSLFITESPLKDKGKKFLIWEYVEEGKADQWIYLPELRQVRRVQPHRHHHDGEMESELVIEDVRLRRIETDTHRLLPEEELEGESHAVIETQIQGGVLYKKTKKYFSQTTGLLDKIEYFSEAGTLVKTQSIDWEEVDGTWVWKRSETLNARTGRKTRIELSAIAVNTGLRDDQFSERALRR